MNKKNEVITSIIIIISSLSFIVIGFIIGINYNKTNNIIENSSQFNVNKDNSNENLPNDNMEEIINIQADLKLVKESNDLNNLEKAVKISSILYQNTFKILKIEKNVTCEKTADTYACFFIDDQNVNYNLNISNNFKRVLIDQTWYNLFNENNSTDLSLDKLINYLNYNAYSKYLIKELNISQPDGIYSYMQNKFSLTEQDACIGYDEDKNFFNIKINKVNNSKLGWYYFDKWTGKCQNTIDTVAIYRINKKDYTYKVLISS